MPVDLARSRSLASRPVPSVSVGASATSPAAMALCTSRPVDTSIRAKPRRGPATTGPNQLARSPLDRRRGPTWTTIRTLIVCHSIRPAQVKATLAGRLIWHGTAGRQASNLEHGVRIGVTGQNIRSRAPWTTILAARQDVPNGGSRAFACAHTVTRLYSGVSRRPAWPVDGQADRHGWRVLTGQPQRRRRRRCTWRAGPARSWRARISWWYAGQRGRRPPERRAAAPPHPAPR